MSQNDYIIANDTAANVRADLNLALQALASTSSGATEPSTTYANMLWYDTANNILKMRSEADDAWIDLGTLDQSANTFTPAGVAELTQTQVEDDTSTVFGQVSGQRLAQAIAALSSGGTTTLIREVDLSVGGPFSTVDFTEFDATLYQGYKFRFTNVTGGGGNWRLSYLLSRDGGLTYDTGASDYTYVYREAFGTTETGTGNTWSGVDASGVVTSGWGVNAELDMHDPALAAQTAVYQRGVYLQNGESFYGSATRSSNDIVNGIRFRAYPGRTITGGIIQMIGIKRGA